MLHIIAFQHHIMVLIFYPSYHWEFLPKNYPFLFFETQNILGDLNHVHAAIKHYQKDLLSRKKKLCIYYSMSDLSTLPHAHHSCMYYLSLHQNNHTKHPRILYISMWCERESISSFLYLQNGQFCTNCFGVSYSKDTIVLIYIQLIVDP